MIEMLALCLVKMWLSMTFLSIDALRLKTALQIQMKICWLFLSIESICHEINQNRFGGIPILWEILFS